MESRDQRIATLATTLKSSGIAKTDSQARMMAEEMIGVEEHVQKSYEEEHEKAHEYLQTAKNLRVPRPASASEIAAMQSSNEQKSTNESKSTSRIIEPVMTQSRNENAYSNNSDSTFNPLNSGKVTGFSGHDTHNSALEAIKSQIQKDAIISQESKISSITSTQTNSNTKEDDLEVSITSSNTTEASLNDAIKETAKTLLDTMPVTQEPISPTADNSSVTNAGADSQVVVDNKLDAKKLVELMEEDGKLEENTREIKEAPKNVKPKEEYVENSIDLSSVFSFNKK
jgi:hypothetical protein